MRCLGHAVVVILGMVMLAHAGCTALQEGWYLSMLPSQIQVDRVLSMADESGIREGCGAVIFELSEATLVALRRSGKQALADAHQARGHAEAYFSFGTWQETPYVRTGEGLADRWLVGMSCGGLDSEWERRIFEAVARPGSYFATSPESGLTVIPALRIVVLSYFG